MVAFVPGTPRPAVEFLAPAAVPANITPPSITGTAKHGETLTAHDGTWSGGPTLTRQWRRDGDAVSGQTATTYLVTGDDIGGVFTLYVSAVNTHGSANAISAGTAPVEERSDMNQGLRQASVRAATGTAYAYNDDWIALFNQAGTPAGAFNDRMKSYINTRLGTSYLDINDAMRAFAVNQGFSNWGAMGTFNATGLPAAKILIVSGQSNAGGFGTGGFAAAHYTAPDPSIKMWTTGSAWATYYPGGSTYFANTYSDSASGYWGPEAEWAYQWKLDHPGEALWIVKYEAGGTPLGLNAGGFDLNVNSTGEGWDALKSAVNAASANLVGAGYAPQYLAFLWVQGESDAGNTSYANAYAQNLTDLITTSRSLWGGTAMSFVTGRIGSLSYGSGDGLTVRAAQLSVTRATTNAEVVNEDDMTYIVDNVHIDGPGMTKLGARMYEASKGVSAPTVANALVNQSWTNAGSYQFASNTFASSYSEPLTYAATLGDGSALPGWLSFNATTRTFSGTAPSTQTITAKVTATDVWLRSVSATFSLTDTVVVAAPGQVTGLTAGTVTATTVPLSWTAPGTGGAPTDYLVEYAIASSGSWSTFADGTSTTTSATVTGLTTSTAYDFRVSAVNGTGTGTASSTVTATPTAAPSIAAFDPTNKGSGITLSNSNRTATDSGAAGWNDVRTLNGKTTGKWYFEYTMVAGGADNFCGLVDGSASMANYPGTGGNGCGFFQGSTFASGIFTSGGNSNLAGTSSAGNKFALCVDMDAKKAWVMCNNTANPGGGDPVAGTSPNATWTGSPTLYAAVALNGSGVQISSTAVYTPPTGYSRWT